MIDINGEEIISQQTIMGVLKHEEAPVTNLSRFNHQGQPPKVCIVVWRRQCRSQ